MNRLRFRYSAVVLFAASLVGSLLMGGCAGRSTRPAAVPPQDRLGQNLDVHVSNVGSGGGAPSGGLRVDLHVFAKDAQNPVTLEYSVTNLQSQPVLSPIFVTVTLPSTEMTLVDDEHDVTLTVPISPQITFLSGNLTSTIDSLKSGESSITFTTQIQVNKAQWEHVTSLISLIAVSYPDAKSIANGGTPYAIGRTGMQFRLKGSRIEASEIGWNEDDLGAPGVQILHGTVTVNSTAIPVTAIPRHSVKP